MRIVQILEFQEVRKTKEEYEAEAEICNSRLVYPFKKIHLEKPEYLIRVSIDEFQLISFYLELEKRNPIMNVEVKTELKEILK